MKQEVNYDKWLLTDDTSTTLPSGMPCVLRFPPDEYFLRIGAMPGGNLLVSAVSQGIDVATLVQEAEASKEADIAAKKSSGYELDLAEVRNSEFRLFLLITYVIVSPVFSLEPVSGTSFHPRRLRPEDRTFILRWYEGQMKSIAKGGRADAETFPAESGAGALADERGGEVSQVAG